MGWNKYRLLEQYVFINLRCEKLCVSTMSFMSADKNASSSSKRSCKAFQCSPLNLVKLY